MDATAGPGAQKVPLYSINDLKNATDDALAPCLVGLPAPYTFSQSHYYTNIRLLAGYTAVLIGAATFFLDWKLGWDATKHYTAVACVLYFICNGFLTLWIWKIEAGQVFVGYREGGQKLTLRSSVTKHIPVYRMQIVYEAPSGEGGGNKEVEGRFTQWFDEAGYLQRDALAEWLGKHIQVVRMALAQDKHSSSSDGLVGTSSPSGDASASGRSKNVGHVKRRA